MRRRTGCHWSAGFAADQCERSLDEGGPATRGARTSLRRSVADWWHPIIICAAIVAGAAGWACWISVAGGGVIIEEPLKPNIVLIVVDDMGYGDLGCYGSKAIVTPRIDRMAAEGIRFTDAYSGCPVCAPARCTLMTGMHMGHASVRSNAGGVPLLDGDYTIAEMLKKAGYATGGFGKWGLGDLGTQGAPEKQGFDEFFGYYHQIHAHDYYPDYLIDTGKRVELADNVRANAAPPRDANADPLDAAPAMRRQFTPHLILERAKRFMRAKRDGPFFCYLPWTPPHARYEIPESDPAWAAVREKPWPDDAKGHAAYCMLIDRHVGEVLDLLADEGIDDRTIVLFMSDNGASGRFEGTLDSCGPLRGRKRDMYEGGLRVPLVVRWPRRIKAGTVSDLPVYFPDFMPTLAELAGDGTLAPGGIDGLSFVPALAGRESVQTRHVYLYWEWPPYRWGKDAGLDEAARMAAVRMGKWKAVRKTPDAAIELYDLSQDIGEAHDVAAEHADVVAAMAEHMAESHTPARAQPEPEHPAGRKFN